MTSVTGTVTATPEPGQTGEVNSLLSSLELTHVKPLWAQMNRLNPPLPNPQTVPHLWEYEAIRPQLLEAGRLVTEKQAERRVLMLVNPARSKCVPRHFYIVGHDSPFDRRAIHYRHSLRRTPVSYAKRDRSSPQTHRICDALHN